MMDRGDIVVDKLCGVDTEAFGIARVFIYACSATSLRATS